MLDRDFVDVLCQSVKDNWRELAFSDYDGESYTYAEVAHWIAKMQLLFERNGLKQGDTL